MAMEHPVAGVAGNELHIARLRHSYEYGVSRAPRGLWLSSSFRARDDKLMAVKMDRMVVHAEVDETDADALPVSHDERSVGWTRLSVEGEPVELHVHRVRHLDVRQDGVLLHNDCEVFVGTRLVWFLGVHDERADKDFAIIMQEYAILPNIKVPNS